MWAIARSKGNRRRDYDVEEREISVCVKTLCVSFLYQNKARPAGSNRQPVYFSLPFSFCFFSFALAVAINKRLAAGTATIRVMDGIKTGLLRECHSRSATTEKVNNMQKTSTCSVYVARVRGSDASHASQT